MERSIAGWQLTHSDENSLEATPLIPPPADQWWLLRLNGNVKNSSPQVCLDDSRQWLPLLPDERGFALVFHRQGSLKRISLKDVNQNKISISPISTARAIGRMMRAVSQADRKKDEQADRVVRKSWARWRKKGYLGAAFRLVREYHPLLSNQFHNEQPYPLWIEQTEPRLFTKPAPENGPLCILLLSPGLIENSDLQASLAAQTYKHWQCKPLTDEQVAQLPDDALAIPFNQPGCLAPQALAELVLAFQQSPGKQMVYSDEDHLAPNGSRHSPLFKPQWNPDYLEAFNYIGQLCAAQAGPFKAAWQKYQSQDPRPALHQCWVKLGAEIESQGIGHLAKVLFHRKTEPDNELEPNQPAQETTGPSTTTIHPTELKGVYRRQYPLPEAAPLISLLMPTRDALDITRNAVESILHLTDYPNYEILILNNQSEQPATLAWFQEITKHPRVKVLDYNHAFNYSALNNFGAEQAKGELLCLINNDVEVINAQWLSAMARHALRPEIGCVGAKLLYPDNTVQHGGVILGLWGLAGHSHKNYGHQEPGYMNRLMCTQRLSAVTAACLLVKKTIYWQVEGLEEKLTVAFNDVDFCLKVREAGYNNLWTPDALLYHYESKSRGKEDTPEKKARESEEINYMKQKWGPLLQQDPYYSQHLTQDAEDFGIRRLIQNW